MESPHKSGSGLARIGRAFFYSLDGLKAALRHEHAFRQELALAAVLVPVVFLLPAGGVGRALMIGSVLLVLIVELLNSAVEAVVDRVSTADHPLAKRAKDMGSAAVFLCMLNVPVCWALVLAPF